MNKYFGYFAILFAVVVCGLLVATQAHATASGCVSSSWVNISGNGVDAKLNVTNSASCGAKQVSLCSYRVYIRPNAAGWLSTQTLFDSQVITLQPGQTATMTVKTDNCMTQVDAYEGPCVNPFTSDNTSVPNIFAGRMTEYTEVMCQKCSDECTLNDKRCSGNGVQQCKQKSNGCTAWEIVDQCESGETCDGAICKPTCTDECSPRNKRECSGNGFRTCGNYDDDVCLEWSPKNDCGAEEVCNNGSCIDKCYDGSCYDQPTVSLTVTGNGTCGEGFKLKWVSTDATNCQASGAWSGGKGVSGSQTIDSFDGTKTFTIKCWGAGGTATDSVTVEGDSGDYGLDVDAGDDEEIDEDETVKLDGSVDGDYDEVTWECNDGDLSDDNSLRPTFEPPTGSWDYDKVFTCTLTAENECGEDSDTVKIRVNYQQEEIDVNLEVEPDSGCAALTDVDLTAKIDNAEKNKEYEYFFDCENDGDWDKNINTAKDSYTAKNLCDYKKAGTYTAKVKVVSFGRVASDTATIKVKDCNEDNGNIRITKSVRDVNGGTPYAGSVSANPSDTVSYRIEITAKNGDVTDVIVTDAMPTGIENRRNLRLDGMNLAGDLGDGINIGDIDEGQTLVVTYDATVTNYNNFNYGQTRMTNRVIASSNGESATAEATVFVQKSAIAGATTVSTGLGGNNAIGFILGIFGVVLAAICACRSNIIVMFNALRAKLRGDSEQKLAERIDYVKKNNLIA